MEKIEVAENYAGGSFVATTRQTPKEMTQHIRRFKKEAEQKLGEAEAAINRVTFALAVKGASN